MATKQTFYVRIYSAQNSLLTQVDVTKRETADFVANKWRAMIDKNGWAHTVEVSETARA